MLNAGIVDQNVDRPNLGAGLIDHVFDLVGIGDVGARTHHADIVLALEIADDFLDFVGRAKTVERDIGALSGERGRDPKSDTTGLAGHNGGFACPHLIPPQATEVQRHPRRRM